MAMLKLLFVVLALVLAFVVALVSGRSVQKEEEFKRILRASVHGEPQEPLTPELAELQNEWERSGKFEGDIVLSEKQIEALVEESSGNRNAILNSNRYWTNNIVYYHIEENYFNAAQIDAIERGVRDMNELSCLTFRRRVSESNFIAITGMNAGCYSSVGMVGGRQVLNLTPNTPGVSCFRHGTIVHEFLHAVGFYHQQSTHNRDDWVRIVWDKIQAGTEHNFNKYTAQQVTNFDIEYDYSSVLHYSEFGFSIDGSRTIIPLRETGETIGQRVGMSPGDIRKLNLLYKCIFK